MADITYKIQVIYRCSHCDKTFSSEDEVKEHIAEVCNIQQCLGKYFCIGENIYDSKTIEYIKVLGIDENNCALKCLSIEYRTDNYREIYNIDCKEGYSADFLLHDCDEVDKEDFDKFFHNMTEHVERLTKVETE